MKEQHNELMLPASIFIIPGIVVVVFTLLIFVLSGRKNKADNDKNRKNYRKKDKKTQLREANRRLAQNPKDAEALYIVAENHLEEGEYEKAMRSFEILIDLCATDKELDEFLFTLKHAIAALHADHLKEAYKSFKLARTMNDDVFEINYNLGFLEYRAKNYEKAQARLQQAMDQQPEHFQTLKYLGLTRIKLKKYREASVTLRKALDLNPEDKESIYALGQAYHNLGKNEQALQVFSHLRTDPQIGPTAALFSGSINIKNRKYEEAVLDFTIGLRHEKIKIETRIELMYRRIFRISNRPTGMYLHSSSTTVNCTAMKTCRPFS